MKFVIDPTIFSFFPGMHLMVALPEPLRNVDPEGKVSQYWKHATHNEKMAMLISIKFLCSKFNNP